MKKLTYKRLLFWAPLAVSVIAISTFAAWIFVDDYQKKHEKPVITSHTQPAKFTSGSVRVDNRRQANEKLGKPLKAAPHQSIEFISEPTKINNPANAVVVTWAQSGSDGASLQVRTKNGASWSEWAPIAALDGGKDGSGNSDQASSIVLARNINDVQIKVTLQGGVTGSSSIDLSGSEITAIDSRKGPSSEKTLKDKLFDALPSTKEAAAIRSEGPQVISRAQWGSPEPTWSTWQPEYAPLTRAIVHHTATTESSDSYADVRAIWQYHARALGWGDIGYNYIVDSSGRVFEGRYSDRNHTAQNNVDVIGGHAYGNNTGTTGISIIGNYDTRQPTQASLNAVSEMVGYKLASYGIDPRGNGPSGEAVVGHFQVYSTSCPGANVRSRLGDIKNLASGPFAYYKNFIDYDYSHVYQKVTRDGVVVNSDTRLNPGDNVILSVGLKNTGTQTWTNSGATPVRLATDRPMDRASSLYHPSWPGPNRTSTFTSKVDPRTGILTPVNAIQPGEVGVFTFPITVPSYNSPEVNSVIKPIEYFRPVRDGVTWFPRDIGMYPPLTVNTYNWQWLGQGIYTDDSMKESAPSQLLPNTRYYMTMRLKNTGSIPWEKSSMHLGTSWPRDRDSRFFDTTWLDAHRPAELNEASVQPGETGTFKFWVKTPDTASDIATKEYFQPVVEGRTWLADRGVYWDMNVRRNEYNWQWLGQGIYTDDSMRTSAPQKLLPDTRYYLTLNIKNTGTTPLRKDSTLALGTSTPLDRVSSFADSTWLGKNRAARIYEDVIQPGQTGSFRFWIKTPSPSNDLQTREYFRPVVDGVAWLNDYGVYYDLAVTRYYFDWSPQSQALYTDDTASTAVTTAQANQRYYSIVTVKNTGTATWDPSRVRLGTASPNDRTSRIYDSSWLGQNRITANVTTVKPGETARYGFWIQIPSTGIPPAEYFNLVAENITWLPDKNFSLQIR